MLERYLFFRLAVAANFVAAALLLTPATSANGCPVADDPDGKPSGQITSPQELCESIKRLQARYADQVFEVQGVCSYGFVSEQRPTPFYAMFDANRILIKHQLPTFEAEFAMNQADFAKLKWTGMSHAEFGFVDGLLVKFDRNVNKQPRYLVSVGEQDSLSTDFKLVGLNIAFGKFRGFDRELNQIEDSFLYSLASHPSSKIERFTDDPQQWTIEFAGDKLIFRAILATEPELHCTQLDVLIKKTMELATRHHIRYHQTESGWVPKSMVISDAESPRSIVTYNALKLRTDVSDGEFIPAIPEDAELSGPKHLLVKLQQLRETNQEDTKNPKE